MGAEFDIMTDTPVDDLLDFLMAFIVNFETYNHKDLLKIARLRQPIEIE